MGLHLPVSGRGLWPHTRCFPTLPRSGRPGQLPAGSSCPQPILAAVSEETGLVRLHDDHVKELAPVGAHHVPHALVPAERGRGRGGASSSTPSPNPSPGAHAHTKLKGLLVMRKSCFPWVTRRLRTAKVSSPLRMYFSDRGEERGP